MWEKLHQLATFTNLSKTQIKLIGVFLISHYHPLFEHTLHLTQAPLVDVCTFSVEVHFLWKSCIPWLASLVRNVGFASVLLLHQNVWKVKINYLFILWKSCMPWLVSQLSWEMLAGFRSLLPSIELNFSTHANYALIVIIGNLKSET